MTTRIAVFGSGLERPDDIARARALGTGLARAGYGIVNGGYGGTMSAVAEGAKQAGGTTVGVTCAAFGFRGGGNPHLDRVIEAPTLIARLERLVTMAAGYVVLPGGSGTLLELALVWEHARKGLIEARPIIAWEEPWRAVLERLADGPCFDDADDRITWVGDVDDAVAAVRAAIPP